MTVGSPGGQELAEGAETVGRVDPVAEADHVETVLEVDSVEQHQEDQSDVEHRAVWCEAAAREISIGVSCQVDVVGANDVLQSHYYLLFLLDLLLDWDWSAAESSDCSVRLYSQHCMIVQPPPPH